MKKSTEPLHLIGSKRNETNLFIATTMHFYCAVVANLFSYSSTTKTKWHSMVKSIFALWSQYLVLILIAGSV